MVFLIQNTQNRDTEALQLKLDELIRVNEKARNRMLRLEELTEEEMDKVKKSFTRLAKSDAPLSDEDEEEAPAREPAGRQRKQERTLVTAAEEGD
jgi:low affinity Fe/Cu permease